MPSSVKNVVVARRILSAPTLERLNVPIAVKWWMRIAATKYGAASSAMNVLNCYFQGQTRSKRRVLSTTVMKQTACSCTKEEPMFHLFRNSCPASRVMSLKPGGRFSRLTRMVNPFPKEFGSLEEAVLDRSRTEVLRLFNPSRRGCLGTKPFTQRVSLVPFIYRTISCTDHLVKKEEAIPPPAKVGGLLAGNFNETKFTRLGE